MNEQADLRIRAMALEEIAVAADWAAAEGWNPGLGDAACFATVDAGGFLIGELDGAPADRTLFVPRTDWILQPIVAIVPLQLLAYHVAREKGLNVDQPRNLAKTVTVE